MKVSVGGAATTVMKAIAEFVGVDAGEDAELQIVPGYRAQALVVRGGFADKRKAKGGGAAEL